MLQIWFIRPLDYRQIVIISHHLVILLLSCTFEFFDTWIFHPSLQLLIVVVCYHRVLHLGCCLLYVLHIWLARQTLQFIIFRCWKKHHLVFCRKITYVGDWGIGRHCIQCVPALSFNNSITHFFSTLFYMPQTWIVSKKRQLLVLFLWQCCQSPLMGVLFDFIYTWVLSSFEQLL